MQIPKLIKNGKVAVLISRGFGAGWSTWSDGGKRDVLAFHKDIIEAVIDGDNNKAASIAQKLITENFPGDDYFYDGGNDGLDVEWVPQGCQFEIKEYDGRESIHVIGSGKYFTA